MSDKSKRRTDRLRFPEQVKNNGWRITRDENGDERVLLTKGSEGDHIYPLSKIRFGVWVSRSKISRLISKFEKTDGCIVEQVGDGEAILSWPYKNFNRIARMLHAAKRKKVSRKLRSHLKTISPLTADKPHVQSANKQQKSTNGCHCILFAGHALLGLASGGCSRQKESKAWELIEVLLNSYAIRRTES